MKATILFCLEIVGNICEVVLPFSVFAILWKSQGWQVALVVAIVVVLLSNIEGQLKKLVAREPVQVIIKVIEEGL